MRSAAISRETTETRIHIKLELDGSGRCSTKTGVGFLDHMLEQLARHALFDLSVKADGDRHIDDHHTTEDVGIVLGQALSAALSDKRGIRRYGSCSLPMDDAWVDVALDLSGRPFLSWKIELPTARIGSFDTELVREFFSGVHDTWRHHAARAAAERSEQPPHRGSDLQGCRAVAAHGR